MARKYNEGVYKAIEEQIITSGSMTGTATITSSVIEMVPYTNLSIHLVWTGTPNGTFAFYWRNDDTDWLPLDSATFQVSPDDPAGSATSSGVIIKDLGVIAFKMEYTNVSSTGTLNAYSVKW